MNLEKETIELSISNDFKKIIERFSTSSIVAKKLLGQLSKDELVEDHIDFISISHEDKNKISYLNSQRISMLKKSGNDLWTSPSRYHCKPGAFIGKIFKGISPKEVEIFSNLYRYNSNKKDFQFKTVQGSLVRDYYHQRVYNSQSGSLGASCMKYDRCVDNFLNIYVDNKNVSLLVMFGNDDTIYGRALLWNALNEKGETVKVMDRIYTTKDEEYSPYFKDWASENGYLYKSYQNWANPLQFELDKKNEEIKLEVNIIQSIYSYYPYFDTFKWLDVEKNKLYNYLPSHFNSDQSLFRVLALPDGGYQNSDYFLFDEIDRGYFYRGDMIWLENRSIYTSTRNCYYSETLGLYILRDDATYYDDLQDYHYKGLSNEELAVLVEKRFGKKEKLDSNGVYNGIFAASVYQFSSRGTGILQDVAYDQTNAEPQSTVDEVFIDN